MPRTHVNPKTGKIEECKATQKCPFGENFHFDTPEQAERFNDTINELATSIITYTEEHKGNLYSAYIGSEGDYLALQRLGFKPSKEAKALLERPCTFKIREHEDFYNKASEDREDYANSDVEELEHNGKKYVVYAIKSKKEIGELVTQPISLTYTRGFDCTEDGNFKVYRENGRKFSPNPKISYFYTQDMKEQLSKLPKGTHEVDHDTYDNIFKMCCGGNRWGFVTLNMDTEDYDVVADTVESTYIPEAVRISKEKKMYIPEVSIVRYLQIANKKTGEKSLFVQNITLKTPKKYIVEEREVIPR